MSEIGGAKKKAEKLKALARAELGALSDAEKRMLDSAATGSEAMCGPFEDRDHPSYAPEFSETGSPKDSVERWDKNREIRAEAIRWLCTDEDAKKLIDPSGIFIAGARIVNALNLTAVSVPVRLGMSRCRLMEPALFRDAQLEGVFMDGSWTRDISFSGATIRHSLTLRDGFRADGPVDLSRARVAHDIDLSSASLLNPSGFALQGEGLNAGYVFLNPYALRSTGLGPSFRAEGIVSLIGAVISGDLECTGAQFHNPGGTALVMSRATIGGGVYLRTLSSTSFTTEGFVDLRSCHCKDFEDDPKRWPAPGQLALDGFIYDGVSGDGWDAETRKQWLALDMSNATQPYRQLAKVLRESGQEEGATQVLIAMEGKLASLEPAWKRLPERAFLGPIGYGYRPGRALWGLFAISALGAVLYRRSKMIPTDKDAANAVSSGSPLPEHYPKFHPVIFSVENTFPLVKLGQGDKWQPLKSGPRWAVWVQILLGWLLATLFVAGIAGLVQHN